ncbi:4-hydroxythreonine-4-phosphate dehydrogenase PdxA [Arthrobacter sp. ISL-5]|uniref:4-hydroxythreonine-4-phosphate dehydrogenase PdxA n=1 Tax=Arthrobacter sp. ISL-5 TaxID=2819111 RepID=UPI001BE80868|nr:4-hydroxythreonine-4-phosphate dehydrogenase PdxA [Arthrobacter sp. ISL-5]MBT2552137.1 4-hydroxythreonine-4-phosphate dehydrogenase PdxA [Arthrobacter sp. ISL-5]
MTAVLIQADDFSGAAEVGQCFATQGLGTRLLLAGTEAGIEAGGANDASDVLVVDTHTRAVAPEAAEAAVSGVFGGASAARAHVLFKKIDSLWRGNVGPELGALTGLGHHVVVAGALPQLGRTVVDGEPMAGGVRLDRTGLWNAEAAAPPSSVERLLNQPVGSALALAGLDTVRSGCLAAFLGEALSGGGPATVIADGETEDDLEAVADALLELEFAASGRRIVLAGTGGIAALLARKLGTKLAKELGNQPARNTQSRHFRWQDQSRARAITPVLAAVGSASATAAAQLLELEKAGFSSLRIAPAELREPEACVQRLLSAKQLLAAGTPTVLTVSADVVNPQESGAIVRSLGRLVADAAGTADLILTGGETAREVLDDLGIRHLTPVASAQHGAVVSVSDDGRLVGTKPGSFGDDHALVELYLSIKDLRPAAFPAGPATEHPDNPSHQSGADMTSAAANNTDASNTGQDTRPFIAVTMGDGAGVGPEVTVGALVAENAYRDCRPVVIGDTYRLQLGAKALGVKADIVEVASVRDAVFEPGRINVIDPKLLPVDLPWGKESAEAGNAAYHYIRIACELGMSGQVQGICTAPLNKAALHKAGHIYPGHTELLAHFMGIEEVSMMLSTPKVKVIHVTTHIGLIDAINKIEPGLVERTVRRGYDAMQRAGIAKPKIGVCAINPHAGENGLFGYGEEAEKITPAIEKLQADGIDARGPLPADTAFFLAGRGDYDLIVAMYHDQGHGPVKVLGIEAGVNITVGLPVIRTSVDHGTAFDIAGKGIVEVGSMIEALRQAAEMSPSPAASPIQPPRA